jgi:hypothetical protein
VLLQAAHFRNSFMARRFGRPGKKQDLSDPGPAFFSQQLALLNPISKGFPPPARPAVRLHPAAFPGRKYAQAGAVQPDESSQHR